MEQKSPPSSRPTLACYIGCNLDARIPSSPVVALKTHVIRREASMLEESPVQVIATRISMIMLHNPDLEWKLVIGILTGGGYLPLLSKPSVLFLGTTVSGLEGFPRVINRAGQSTNDNWPYDKSQPDLSPGPPYFRAIGRLPDTALFSLVPTHRVARPLY